MIYTEILKTEILKTEILKTEILKTEILKTEILKTEILKNVWKALYDPKIEVVKTVEQFFHQNYEQCINGISMNRNEYVQHVLEQKKNMTIETVDYKHILEKEDELFAIYYPRGKNVNNLPIEAEVIVYFRFENQKIIRVHGLVRLIKGDLADVDMHA